MKQYRLIRKLGTFPLDIVFEGEPDQQLSVIDRNSGDNINRFITTNLSDKNYFEVLPPTNPPRVVKKKKNGKV